MIKRTMVLMIAILLLPGLALAQTQTRATFLVEKHFTDGNPNEVEVTISCNTGLPIEQSADIDEWSTVNFVVVNFDDGEMDCTVSEATPNGYEASYWADSEAQGSADSDEDGCHFTGVFGGDEYSCSIENTPIPVTVEVNKEWVYSNTDGNEISDEYSITLQCNAEIEGGYEIGWNSWRAHENGEGDDTFWFTVHPTYGGNTCTATESLFDSAVESDNSDCEGMAIDIAQGAECTIVNTVFYEGIPTLNQYGLALMALLMLGVGFVGFRRFA